MIAQPGPSRSIRGAAVARYPPPLSRLRYPPNNFVPSVAAPGSRGAVLGSNPIAYGIPVGDGDPIILDMATAAVAGGKVYAAHQRGEPIPPTWLIGPDGKPTTDGSLYPHQASLAPMAGHKGYGFGLWCEIL